MNIIIYSSIINYILLKCFSIQKKENGLSIECNTKVNLSPHNFQLHFVCVHATVEIKFITRWRQFKRIYLVCFVPHSLTQNKNTQKSSEILNFFFKNMLRHCEYYYLTYLFPDFAICVVSRRIVSVPYSLPPPVRRILSKFNPF